jgi:large subunit ribosomal protein L3
MKAIYGKKLGMTRIFTEGGKSVAATVLEMGPNVVHQVKTTESDSYEAIQIGFGSQKTQRLNRATAGHVAKAEKGTPRFIGEIRLSKKNGAVDDKGAPLNTYKIGDVITVDGMFEVGQRVDVVGTSIGKGFAGVMKRHHMKGSQTMTHGTHEYFRHGGSIGCRKFPGRVFKNKRMPGHMGVSRVYQMGLEVIAVRPEDNCLLVKGSVPGPKDAVVFVRQAAKIQ